MTKDSVKMTISSGGRSFECTTEDLEKAAANLGHNSEVKGIIARILNVMTEQDTLAEDLKELNEELKAKGLSKDEMKGVKLAIREHRKPLDETVKQSANKYFKESGGNYDLFA